VVVGAGIAGLAAAHRLTSRGADVDVVVLEGAPRIGGKLLVGEVAGVAVDTGAEVLLNRRPEAVALAQAAGLGGDVCHPVATSAAIWSRGGVRPMPPTVMGIPADLAALRRSGIVTPLAVDRAGSDADVQDGRAPQDDVSVADFVSRRLGVEIVDRLVEPILGGVYAGHASRLSLFAAAPQIAALAARGGSLVAAARATLATSAASPVFAGIRGGVGRLPAAVASTSGSDVRVGAPVRELSRGDRFRLVVGPTRSQQVVTADAVVLATPAAPTARLLRDVCPVAAQELGGIEYASMAVVTLAVPVSALPPVSGSGFLVPAVTGRSVKGVTYSWRKWAWLAEGRDDIAVLRASIGRHREERVLQGDDTALVDLARSDLAATIGLRGPALDSTVTRWGGALPQYQVGHLERVARIRSAVARVPRLEVCGAAYDGIGIAACVADGQRAADRLLAALRSRDTMAP